MKQIYLIVTKKCNLSCSFCIRDYGYNLGNSLSIDDYDLVIDRLKQYWSTSNFIISGGEPTVHKNFSYFLQKACEKFKKVTINTNGTNKYFSTKKFTDIIENNKIRIQFSIDGAESVHNEIRGKGNYQKTLNNIKICKSYKNTEIIISTTVSNLNFLYDFKNLYNDLKSYVNVWNIKRVSYSGEASNENFDYLNNDEWNQIVENVKKIDVENIINIQKMYDFLSLDGVSDEMLSHVQSKVIKNCGSGTSKIYIYPNLDVLACTCYEKKPSGNLKNQDIHSILSGFNHLNISAHEIDHPICNSCRYKKVCNGGCLGAGYYSTGSLNEPDIKCPKIFEHYQLNSDSKKQISLVQI